MSERVAYSVVRVTQREKDAGVYDLRFTNPKDIIRTRDFIDQKRDHGLVNIIIPSIGDISVRLAMGTNISEILDPSMSIEYTKST